MNTSLMTILRSDPELAKRLEQGTKEVRENKRRLVSSAQEYNDRYKNEVDEGTKKKRLLIEMGRQEGKTETEVLQSYGRFLPSVQTPLLNFLYFLLRESENDSAFGQSRYEKRNRLDEEIGNLQEEDVAEVVMKKVPEISEYLYGSATLDQFDVLKKLKSLTRSDNVFDIYLCFIEKY